MFWSINILSNPDRAVSGDIHPYTQIALHSQPMPFVTLYHFQPTEKGITYYVRSTHESHFAKSFTHECPRTTAKKPSGTSVS